MSINTKNLDTLINDSLAIEFEEAKSTGNLGFMARALVQATLPHRRISSNEFSRKNGLFKLVILADSSVGLPYGNIPRLLLAWISTEAVRTRQREIALGESMSKFMEQLDLTSTGGCCGSITRFKDQVTRLFSSSFSCTYDDGKHWAIKNVTPISKASLWWNLNTTDLKQDGDLSSQNSTILLGEEFFNEIICKPIPMDMRALKALKHSPMALDIYCWLTYRKSYLKKNIFVPWETLEMQFGTNYARTRDFKKKFLYQLKKVYVVYSEAKVEINNRGLILKPSKPHVNINNVTNPVNIASYSRINGRGVYA